MEKLNHWNASLETTLHLAGDLTAFSLCPAFGGCLYKLSGRPAHLLSSGETLETPPPPSLHEEIAVALSITKGSREPAAPSRARQEWDRKQNGGRACLSVFLGALGRVGFCLALEASGAKLDWARGCLAMGCFSETFQAPTVCYSFPTVLAAVCAKALCM